MKILITGVAGFIGSSIAEEFLSFGSHEVTGIDSFTDYYDPRLKRANVAPLVARGLRLIEGDLNQVDLAELLSGVEVVYHQAGQPGVRKSWGSEFSIYSSANIAATQALLEAARMSSSLHRFVYASSSSVYGDAESYPTTELDRPQPRSPYGATKLAAEHLCSLYAANFGLPTVSLRYFTVYGPKQRPDMAFNRFIMAALTHKDIVVYGDGEQIREFTHVSDIVRANVLAGTREIGVGEVINLSGGSSVSVNEVLRTLSVIADRDLDISYTESVAGDVLRTGGSTVKATELLGWQPEVSIGDGLRSEYEWLAGRLGSQ